MSRHTPGKQEKPAPDQLEFDYERPRRRKWIQEIQIPPFSYLNSRGKREFVIRTSTMKDCLKAIESTCGKTPDAGFHLFKKQIADLMGVSDRTVSRAVGDCKGARLLAVRESHDPHKESHYQILWNRVIQILAGNPETSHLVDNDDLKMAGVVDNDGNTTRDKLSETHDKLSETHDKLSAETSGNTSYTRARGFHHDSKPVNKPSCETKSNGYAGWPFKIELPHLKHHDSIERLWRAALVRRDVIVDESDRLRFFTLARYVARLSTAGEIAKPGGYFHAQLVRRDKAMRSTRPNWLGEPVDIEWANKAIAYADCASRETAADRAARGGR